MNRRFFLFSALASVRVLRTPRAPARITRITLVPIDGRFHKFVAMNAYDQAPKGHTYSNTLIRIQTDQGIEGVGVMGYAVSDPAYLQALHGLVGANPLEVFLMTGGRVTGPAPSFQALLTQYRHLDGPLFDLLGKLEGKPCWKLIGEAARQTVEVYDGTLYFSDLWFRDRGVHAVVEEAEESVKKGYRGLKIKLGRGFKWMEKTAGLQRDIEVVRAVRNALGHGVKILVDANNGYQDDLEGPWRLLAQTQEANLFWAEELFPENVAHYTELRDRMTKAGMKTLIADGENMREPQQFRPYLAPRRLIDVLQMDIRTGGFLGNLEMARLGEPAGAVSVPHNWGSQVGLLMGLHLAKAVGPVTAAEDDRSTCDVLRVDGYEFQQGHYKVSNSPGLGIHVNERAYRDKYQTKEQAVE
jgi:L-alanine-DL-glutamate epimerase-like enolase superfamily enzyme